MGPVAVNRRRLREERLRDVAEDPRISSKFILCSAALPQLAGRSSPAASLATDSLGPQRESPAGFLSTSTWTSSRSGAEQDSTTRSAHSISVSPGDPKYSSGPSCRNSSLFSQPVGVEVIDRCAGPGIRAQHEGRADHRFPGHARRPRRVAWTSRVLPEPSVPNRATVVRAGKLSAKTRASASVSVQIRRASERDLLHAIEADARIPAAQAASRRPAESSATVRAAGMSCPMSVSGTSSG